MTNSTILGIDSGKIDRIIVVRIKKDVDLLESIKEIAKKEKIKTAFIVSGIGALKRGVFRNLKHFPKNLPVQDSDREFIEIKRPLELLSLAGHICEKEGGEPFIHAHFSASHLDDENKLVALGGHLIKGNITSIKITVVVAVLKNINMRAKHSKESESIELSLPG